MPVNFEILVGGIDDEKIPQEDKEPCYAFFRDAAMKMTAARRPREYSDR
jgi:hypothetical protein